MHQIIRKPGSVQGLVRPILSAKITGPGYLQLTARVAIPTGMPSCAKSSSFSWLQ